ARTRPRWARVASARPKWTISGVSMAMPEWRCSALYQRKKSRQKVRASSMEAKRPGNSGQYLRVLNWASEKGLSSETWGLEWDLVIPRSASRKATGLEVMDEPRSAWTVSWS